MFRNLAEKHILQYCGCDGGSGGDANCGCGGSSGGGGDSDGDGLNDAFDSSPNGGMGSESNMDDPSNTGIGNSAAAAAANTPGGYATDGWGSYTTGIGTFGEDGKGGHTFSSRDFSAASPNMTESRRDGLIDDAKDAQWNAADTFSEYAQYAADHHLGSMVGLMNPLAGLAVSAVQDVDKGYSPGRVAGNAVAGVAAPMVGGLLGKATYGITESPVAAAVASKVGSKVASDQIVAAASRPTSTADETIDTADDSTADQTLQQIASVTDQNDPYADAGFGNYRNRQIRSRVSRPLLRG